MATWDFNERNLKRYPHFDPIIPVEKAVEFATSPSFVESHAFFPFMRYVQSWNRYAKKGEEGKRKEREIRFAARRDAYIFSYYRHLLSEKYEAELKRLGISDSVLAYRRILVDGARGGKCNIDFAKDAFLKIQELKNCVVLVLDISKYFESLDHTQLKALWCRLLKCNKLPPDHFQVFKAITEYAVVDKQAVYERLGHYGSKRTTKTGKTIKGYLTPLKKISPHLCEGPEFREKIAGIGGKYKSLIEKNFKPYGIPQGAPISDLLANLYLIDFDTCVASWAKGLGGAYYRYSDDILIVIPGGASVGTALKAKVMSLIPNFGSKLEIKASKTSTFVYQEDGPVQKFELVDGEKGKNGLEYLGFRFDGRFAYLRDSTLANLNRKMTYAARRRANAFVTRYPNRDMVELKKTFNFEDLIKKFGKVENFEDLQLREDSDRHRTWTFWTYARRASDTFGSLGTPILSQLVSFRRNTRLKAIKELDRAVRRRRK